MLRDVMDIAGRDLWSFPPFDSRDIEGEDVRAAAVGQLTAVYWINRPAGRLYIIDTRKSPRTDTWSRKPRAAQG
ncbi:hypothetical protein ACFY1L_55615 [Streptomyces sp. NPDC001663]|uniref:hypothetical protein n=1 Tax=Streptomyces sp. NPDC001663 TaxID=3364597 RepID=UPI0036B11805